MKRRTGDLIELANRGAFDVIVHGCNCQNVMGSGIARQIKAAFPDAWKVDQATSRGFQKLGMITVAEASSVVDKKTHHITIVNAYTQVSYGPGVQVDYSALGHCLYSVARLYHGQRIGLPLIGCGLGGGNWEKVKEVMFSTLGVAQQDYTVVALPGEEPEDPWDTRKELPWPG
jgi:O-acetyl-ADP-ribose deacetylase (regulator of RNase III)